MKKLFNLLVLALLLTGCTLISSENNKNDANGNFKPLTTKSPERPPGQKDVLGLTAPKIETVRVGFIGLGQRGPRAVSRFTHIPGVEIVALCDLHADRVEKTQKILEKAGLPAAAEYSGSEESWKELCQRDDIDLVYITTDWKRHASMMIYAMEQGKHTACEVPAAMTMEEIWDVIDTAEKTQKHCMQLENCVYDFFELTTLNMAQKGVFGEVLYVEGAYIHHLEAIWDRFESDWRLEYNKNHRGDIYATHGMGPVCQLLDIHRGDKMNYLVAMDSKPVSIPNYIKNVRGEDPGDFKNGQHTMTMIKTEKGKTIHIQHDVASPRPYSRMYQLTGTKGFANKYPVQGYALESSQIDSDVAPNHEELNQHSFLSEEVMKALMEKYKHPIHKELEEKAKKVGGHGGMDFIMDSRLIYCLQNGLPLDMDVYDLAEWTCLAPLTALSLENNSAPVEIPDFTRGGWNKTKGYRHAFVE
ncbi:MAG: Gfo/Idh/MocA family oxidoreductase [Dysgonamonadaceae bacterium]|nr:Gfo/Idh/MocA family oxidoreductase [Dysgonamonadaceae bacterium]